MIAELDTQVMQKVKSEIAAYTRVFVALDQGEQKDRAEKSEQNSQRLAFQYHHRVTCPACQSVATVHGQTFGHQTIDQDEERIVSKQAVMPESFSCVACGLKLNGYSQLVAAELGDQYTRTIYFTPEEYYGLVNPEDFDQIEQVLEQHNIEYFQYNND